MSLDSFLTVTINSPLSFILESTNAPPDAPSLPSFPRGIVKSNTGFLLVPDIVTFASSGLSVISTFPIDIFGVKSSKLIRSIQLSSPIILHWIVTPLFLSSTFLLLPVTLIESRLILLGSMEFNRSRIIANSSSVASRRFPSKEYPFLA